MNLREFIKKMNSAQKCKIHFSAYYMYVDVRRAWDLSIDEFKDQPEEIQEVIKMIGRAAEKNSGTKTKIFLK